MRRARWRSRPASVPSGSRRFLPDADHVLDFEAIPSSPPLTRDVIVYSICGYDCYQFAHAKPRTEEGVGGTDHPLDHRTARPSWIRDQQAHRDALDRAAEVPRRIAVPAPLSVGRTRLAAREVGREGRAPSSPLLQSDG